MLNPLKMFCENMLTLVHKVIHLVMLAHLQRRWCLQARWDSALSEKWNAYFLLRRVKILGGWHIGARVEKIEVRTELMPALVQ